MTSIPKIIDRCQECLKLTKDIQVIDKKINEKVQEIKKIIKKE